MSKAPKHQVFTNRKIIDLFFERDETAIRETDKKYGAYLYRVAYNILHDREDCEECQNDTYLDLWHTIPPTRPCVFPAFLNTVMRRIAIDKYKKKRSRKRVPSELTVAMDELDGVADGIAEAAYAERELSRVINTFVEELTEERQYLFIGRYYMAHTVKHMAKELGVSPATVYRDLEKIKSDLKLCLGKEGFPV